VCTCPSLTSATDQKKKWQRRAPATRLEPLHHVLCAARSRRLSRSARRRRSPGYSVKWAAQPVHGPLTATFTTNTPSVTYCSRPDALIVQASRVRGAATQAYSDPDKQDFDVSGKIRQSSLLFRQPQLEMVSMQPPTSSSTCMANGRYPSTFICARCSVVRSVLCRSTNFTVGLSLKLVSWLPQSYCLHSEHPQPPTFRPDTRQ